MTYSFQDIIEMFLKGETTGRAGSRSNPGNLSINGNQLIHYTTPIMERIDGEIIVNLSQYSIQTGRLQKQIKSVLEGEKYKTVIRVPRDYKGTLGDFPINEERGGSNETTI